MAANGRLARGQLREMVLAHLRQHAGQKFSPTALGRALDRSAGAMANICGSSDQADGPILDEAQLAEVLVSLESEGLATGVGDTPDAAPAWRRASAPSEERAPADEGTSATTARHQRLRPGELRARVLEFVRGRPREEFSPTAVARALGASAGAVSNALERLVEIGDVVRKADSPRRFSATPKRK